MLIAPRVIAVAGLVALAAVVAPSVPAGAQDTVDLYIVHGLNLDGQDNGSDGGTSLTWCNDTQLADPDVQFGEIGGILGLPGGGTGNNQLYEGTNVDCANPGGALLLIDQTMTLPAAGTMLWVITSGPGTDPTEEAEIMEYLLDSTCIELPNGRSTLAHAAATGPIDVAIDGQPRVSISYGDITVGDTPAGDYDFQLTGGVDLSGVFTVFAGQYFVAISVGLQDIDGPSPLVQLAFVIDLEECPPPSTTTTVATTTTTPAPTTTAAAQPAALQPTFTG